MSGNLPAGDKSQFVIERTRLNGQKVYATVSGGWTFYPEFARRFDSVDEAKAILRKRQGSVVPLPKLDPNLRRLWPATGKAQVAA